MTSAILATLKITIRFNMNIVDLRETELDYLWQKTTLKSLDVFSERYPRLSSVSFAHAIKLHFASLQ